MTKLLMTIYDKTVLQHPLLTMITVLVLALAMVAGLPNFKIDASADSLTLEYDEDLDFFRQLNQRYGSSDILVVTYRPKGMDLFSDESLATLKALTDDLGEIEGVTNVQSLINVPLLFSPKIAISDLKNEARTLLTPGVDRQQAKKEFQTSPIYKDMILGPDGQTTGIVATLSSDARYLEFVRHRDALRHKETIEGLTPEEEDALEEVSQQFLDYRTEAAAKSYRRVQEIRGLMDNYRDRAQLFLGGATMITADMVDYVASDMKVFGAGILLFIVLALAFIFRQFRWVVLPLASCALAVVIMLGWLSWIDWRLTVISSNFVAVLLIISMALTIHLVVRYRELHWHFPDRPQIDLVRETVISMAKPCFYTMLTTVVAFASLVVSNIRPVIDFGWMMTIGLFLAFILVFVVIPAGILLWGKKPVRHRPSEDTPHTLYFSRFTENHGKAVVAISLIVAVASITGISKLQVDNRFIDYFRESTEIHQGLSVIDANLGGTTPLDIIITKKAAPVGESEDTSWQEDSTYGAEGDPFAFDADEADSVGFEDEDFDAEDPYSFDDPFAEDATAESAGTAVPYNYWFTRAGLEELEVLHNYLESLPEIGKVSSLVTAFHAANQLTGHRMNDFELAFMRQTLSPEINNFLIAPYLDDDKGETRISMRTVETASDLKRADLLNQIDRFIQDEMGLEKDEYRFSGLMVLYNNMLQSLYKSQILTLGAVFLGIMLMFLVLFRSLSISLIAITPNILAACAVLGGMGIAGVPLDMMTITIAAITVGIGVDDTIHYIHRFKTEFQQDRNYLATMHRAHGSIGKAMYYTSVIIIAGFSILTLSNFIPSIYFGLLTGVAMLVALLGALALLPKMILIFKPFGKEG
ncbi:MAG: RND family transporter [Porticoccaceae bacterium]